MGDDGAFFGEAFYVFSFFLDKAFGDEEGEVCVLTTGVFEFAV